MSEDVQLIRMPPGRVVTQPWSDVPCDMLVGPCACGAWHESHMPKDADGWYKLFELVEQLVDMHSFGEFGVYRKREHQLKSFDTVLRQLKEAVTPPPERSS